MFKLRYGILVDPRHKKAGFAWWFLEQQCTQRSGCKPQSERPRQQEQQHWLPLCPSSRMEGDPSPNRPTSQPLPALLLSVLAKQIGFRRVSSANGVCYENSPVGFIYGKRCVYECQ